MTRDEVTAGLRDFIRREILLNPEYPLGPGLPLLTGGVLDSLALTRIAVYVETAFGVSLPNTDLGAERMDTLEQMVDRVLEAAASRF